MPKTANEELFDAMLRHQVFLLRLAASVKRETTAILNRTERDIADKIRGALFDVKGITPSAFRKIALLQRDLERIRSKAWDDVEKLWVDELLDLARKEPEFTAGTLRTVSPVLLRLAMPTREDAEKIVAKLPIEGKTIKEWVAAAKQSDLDRIQTRVRIGVVQEDTAPQIARRVVGRSRLRGADGTTQTTRNHTGSIIATALIAIASRSREQFVVSNEALFTTEQFVATLDSRTTPICRSLDGKIFKIGEGPHLPLHFNERSIRIPALDGAALGNRPARTFTQKQLLGEFAEQENIKSVSSRGKLPFGMRGKFDAFARVRMRELTGLVPGRLTYGEWLKSQSAKFQDEVLGATRGKLFRRGELTLDKFVNRQGDEIPLRDLARLEREAFVAAGLDPEDFLARAS